MASRPPQAQPASRTPCSPRRDTSPRGVILSAAEEVILSQGIGSLSLDAIAKQVGLSKSGVLHHFPSKDALIHGLVKLNVDQWREDCEHAIAQQPPGPSRVATAFLDLCLDDTNSFTDECRRSSLILVAALVHDSKHVEPLNQVRRHFASRLAEDGVPDGAAELLLLAIDGLWFGRIFGVSEPSATTLLAIRRALESLIDTKPAPTKAATKPTKSKSVSKTVRTSRPASKSSGSRPGRTRS